MRGRCLRWWAAERAYPCPSSVVCGPWWRAATDHRLWTTDHHSHCRFAQRAPDSPRGHPIAEYVEPNLQSAICNQKEERTVQDQTLEELLEDWKEERISAKEAIDQILRYVQLLLDQVRVLERRASANPAPTPPTPAPARRAAKRR